MEYPVIVEQKNGIWRAVIPALADLSVEGASHDEAMKNAQRAAEDLMTLSRTMLWGGCLLKSEIKSRR